MIGWSIRFNPQIWDSNDYAVDVPPLGESTFRIDWYTALQARELLDSGGHLDESDLPTGHENCPVWVREWQGTGYYDLIGPDGDSYERKTN